MGALQKLPHLVHPQADKGLFTEQVLRELADIREEVEEACSLDSGTAPVPDSAYEETLTFLQQMSRDIPIPDIIWLEDGGIGLEWRPGDGIATMSLYGDGLVIYGATWKGSRKISGTCPLSDPVLLPHFLNVLREFFRQAVGEEESENFEIQITLPLKHVLPQHKTNAQHKAKEAFVLELLRQGGISAGRAASLLNISRWELSDLMFEAGISPFDDSLTPEAFAAEVADALKDFDAPGCQNEEEITQCKTTPTLPKPNPIKPQRISLKLLSVAS